VPAFSPRSQSALSTIHPDLQRVLKEAIKYVDFTVLEGHRGKAAQNAAVAAGKSKTPWPQSKHNATPALAVDIAPYPVDWKDTARFHFLAGFIKGIAAARGISLRWGGDWDGDNDLRDQVFIDLPHFELR
jgi:peptidoglycan L-alanyl-D-glutamate endopeptidase CwlK